MKKFIFITMIFYGFSLNAQQVWTQKKGEGYFQIDASFFSYSSLHIGDFKAMEIPRPIKQSIFSAYGEYGIFDNLTATLILPFQMVSSGELASDWNGFSPEKGDLAALGNISFGLTYKLHEKNGFVVSSKLWIGTNSVKAEPSTGLRTGYNAFGISPLILAGFGTSDFFASMESGFNFLSNGYLPRFVFNAQIGTHFSKSKKFLFVFGIITISALGDPTEEDTLKFDGNARFTGLYVIEQSYYAINLKLGFNLSKNWTIWSSIAGGAAKNVGQGAVYTFSLGYKLRK